MLYFEELSEKARQEIFFKAPSEVDFMDKEIQPYAVGAMLYTPATHPTIAKDLISGKIPSLKSNTLCLEDAIAPGQVEAAIENLREQFRQLQAAKSIKTNLFLRIRDEMQLASLIGFIAENSMFIRGINIPKITPENADMFIRGMRSINNLSSHPVKMLPIIESPEFVFPPERLRALERLRAKLENCKELTMMLRVGATDFCGVYGIRRAPTSTIYDVSFVRSAFADIIGTFGYNGEYIISGPVWEYFSNTKRLFKPLLRYSIFQEKEYNDGFRGYMIESGMENLMREIFLDIENGFLGKTVIHPTHIVPVQAMLAVSHEEYEDALAVSEAEGGVIRSTYSNKMNEINPHRRWAERILKRAEIYGVYNDNSSALDIIHEYWVMQGKPVK